ncbi:hypothetical protein VTJ49DRAFT_7596 [Mycothermus thermophilus]|uniref:NACHT domain-containing protein n=1 Tax=Humicola insolens TaxID=85995 RepID=A0ABR3VGW7_HUMIN
MAADLQSGEPIGLQQLYPREPHVKCTHDLVAVHGFGGDAISTWTNDENTCWLEWLTSDLPGLRVFTFGYEPEPVYLSSRMQQGFQSGVFPFAQNLLGELKDKRALTKQHNPLTFLCYNIGGIVVKHAIVFALSRNQLYQDILNSTVHIIFLDTPHRGLATEAWRDIYGSEATRVGEQQFKQWSPELGQLAEQFAEFASKGSGKSTMVAYLIKHVRYHGHKVLYLFCREAVGLDMSDRINCLTLQMVKRDRKVLKELVQHYEEHQGKQLSFPKEAVRVFQAALRMFGPCFIFLDGLDECDKKDREVLISTMRHAVDEITQGLRIMCTSRDERDLERLLGSGDVTDLPIVERFTSNDIRLMIQDEILKQPELAERLKDSPSQLSEDIINNLTTNARGMFLLPKLVIEELNAKPSTEGIYKLLDNLPENLHDVYMVAVRRIPAKWRPTAREVFAWTAWACRPLRVGELREALQQYTRASFPNLASDIKAACGGLVVVENDVIRFNHSSVRRFFRESETLRNDSIGRQLVVDNAEDLLAEVCTRYLFDDDYGYGMHWCSGPDSMRRFKKGDPARLREYAPLLSYACCYWIFHCRESRRAVRFAQPIHDFVHSKNVLLWLEALAHFAPTTTRPLRQFVGFLRSFVNELKFRVDKQHAGAMERTLAVLSRIRAFLWRWEEPLLRFPIEFHHLSQLVYEPDVCQAGSGGQGIVFTSRGVRGLENLHDMLECMTAYRLCDRLLICDLNIFMWQSLMPSTPWDCAHPKSGPAWLALGSMAVHAALRADMRAVAISWGCFDGGNDPSRPIVIKTSAWLLREEDINVDMEIIVWSDTDLRSSNLVDETRTYAFKGSRCPLAFAEVDGRSCLWTPGGGYDLETGRRAPLLLIFNDQSLESLFLWKRGSSSHKVWRSAFRAGRDRSVCKIWDYRNKPANLDLGYFYNNGGLQAFNDQESLLVVCVPEEPESLLLVFRLASSDVAASVQKITYSQVLQGADILSLAFCPEHEERIYVLSTTKVIWTFNVPGHAAVGLPKESSMLEHNRPVVSAVVHGKDGPVLLASHPGRRWAKWPPGV